MWEKLCWNIPFSGLSVAAGGVGTRTILNDTDLRAKAERIMREVVLVANLDLNAAGQDGRIDGDEIVERMFSQTEAMGDYRSSMLVDFLSSRPLEIESIIGEPLRRARSRRCRYTLAGVTVCICGWCKPASGAYRIVTNTTRCAETRLPVARDLVSRLLNVCRGGTSQFPREACLRVLASRLVPPIAPGRSPIPAAPRRPRCRDTGPSRSPPL